MVRKIKSDWDLTRLFTRPTVAILGLFTIVIWAPPFLPALVRRLRGRATAA